MKSGFISPKVAFIMQTALLTKFTEHASRPRPTTPRIGRSREDLVPRLRSFPLGDYIIYYRPIEEGVEVIRVFQGNRDIESEF